MIAKNTRNKNDLTKSPKNDSTLISFSGTTSKKKPCYYCPFHLNCTKHITKGKKKQKGQFSTLDALFKHIKYYGHGCLSNMHVQPCYYRCNLSIIDSITLKRTPCFSDHSFKWKDFRKHIQQYHQQNYLQDPTSFLTSHQYNDSELIIIPPTPIPMDPLLLEIYNNQTADMKLLPIVIKSEKCNRDELENESIEDAKRTLSLKLKTYSKTNVLNELLIKTLILSTCKQVKQQQQCDNDIEKREQFVDMSFINHTVFHQHSITSYNIGDIT